MIEINAFDRKIISGFLEGAIGRPVKIELMVNGAKMAGNWGVPATNRKGQSFRFNLAKIWDYLDQSARFEVRIPDASLLLPSPVFASSRKLPFSELTEKLANGHVFNEKGGLQLSKIIDVDWQMKMFALYDEMRVLLKLKGIDLVVMYGTLLGARRGANFIGHDHDFDAGYISAFSDPRKAAAELVEVAEVLSRRGFRVLCKYTCIWVTDPRSGVTIDVFHTYFDKNGKLQFPFGVCGTKAFTKNDFEGYKEISLAGHSVLGIANTDALLEYVYGPHWQTPNPGHNWDLDRVERAKEAQPSAANFASIYWTDYYLRSRVSQPSSFAEYISRSKFNQGALIDLGCGNGRDSVFLSEVRPCVIGIDSSAPAVEAAKEFAKVRGGRASLSFVKGNISSLKVIESATKKARIAAGENGITFYGRFLLHSISENQQFQLLSHISANSKKGDIIALEFRTKDDETLKKAHAFRRRRFLNPVDVCAALASIGFNVVNRQEGTGLSPYMTENPHLCRIVAVNG